MNMKASSQSLFSETDGSSTIIHADALAGMKALNDGSVNSIITSPPYWGLRAYTNGDTLEIGIEPKLNAYIDNITSIFHEARRILADDGVLWLNIGDGFTSGGRKTRIPDNIASKNSARGKVYNRPDTPEGLKKKDMLGVPWRVALALQADGWYLRADVIWHKPNQMPTGNIYDRPQVDYEHVFMLTKSLKYKYNIEEGYERSATGVGYRQGRSIWDIPTESKKTGHPAVMPVALADKCIRLTTNEGDTVFDPFTGSGTTGIAALNLGRNFIGTELSGDFVNIACNRIHDETGVDSTIEELNPDNELVIVDNDNEIK